MRLQPRHYVLFLVIVGIFVFNIVRNRRKQPALTPTPTLATNFTAVQTPAWTSFDHAAGLRDAPDSQFQLGLHDLQQQLAATHDSTVTALNGCLTWLEFYRQGVAHPSRDSTWKDRSQHHLDGCVRYHLDASL